MKLSIKSIAIIALVFLTTIAYGRGEEKFSIGLMANPAVSWLRVNNSNIETERAKFGVEYGVITDIHFTENYALSTGISVLVSGGSLSYTNGSLDSLDTRTDLKLQYLNLPIYLKLKTNEIGYMFYYGEFGIINQFRIKGSADANSAGPSVPEESVNIAKKDNELGIRALPFTMGLHIGAGIEYLVSSRTKIQAGLFYNNGFLNIIKDNDDDKIFMNTIGIRAGVIF